jgi:hypothetical protein
MYVDENTSLICLFIRHLSVEAHRIEITTSNRETALALNRQNAAVIKGRSLQEDAQEADGHSLDH